MNTSKALTLGVAALAVLTALMLGSTQQAWLDVLSWVWRVPAAICLAAFAMLCFLIDDLWTLVKRGKGDRGS